MPNDLRLDKVFRDAEHASKGERAPARAETVSAEKAAMPVATPEMHKNAEKLLASARAQATGQRPAFAKGLAAPALTGPGGSRAGGGSSFSLASHLSNRATKVVRPEVRPEAGSTGRSDHHDRSNEGGKRLLLP